MKNLTWQNPEQLFVAQELIKKLNKSAAEFREQYKDNKYAKYLIGNIRVDFIDNGLEDVELVLEAVET